MAQKEQRTIELESYIDRLEDMDREEMIAVAKKYGLTVDESASDEALQSEIGTGLASLLPEEEEPEEDEGEDEPTPSSARWDYVLLAAGLAVLWTIAISVGQWYWITKPIQIERDVANLRVTNLGGYPTFHVAPTEDELVTIGEKEYTNNHDEPAAEAPPVEPPSEEEQPAPSAEAPTPAPAPAPAPATPTTPPSGTTLSDAISD